VSMLPVSARACACCSPRPGGARGPPHRASHARSRHRRHRLPCSAPPPSPPLPGTDVIASPDRHRRHRLPCPAPPSSPHLPGTAVAATGPSTTTTYGASGGRRS
jgi:hypothetical protein